MRRARGWGDPEPARGIEGSGDMSRRVAGVVSNLGAGAGKGEKGECVREIGGEGRNRSDIGLNLGGSWRQGHSATTIPRRVFKSYARILPAARSE